MKGFAIAGGIVLGVIITLGLMVSASPGMGGSPAPFSGDLTGKTLTLASGTTMQDESGNAVMNLASSKRFDIEVNGTVVGSIGPSNSYTTPGLPICYNASCASYIDDGANGTMAYRSGGGAAAQAHIFQTLTDHNDYVSIFEVEDAGVTKFDIDSMGKLTLTTGAAGCTGTATLSSGTATVSTTCVKTGDLVFLSLNTPGGTLGANHSAPVASITDATSFVINAVDSSGSVVTTDTSTINWWVVNN